MVSKAQGRQTIRSKTTMTCIAEVLVGCQDPRLEAVEAVACSYKQCKPRIMQVLLESHSRTHLKNIFPLFPTFATVNCLPSRPADPPSGAISHFPWSASLLVIGRASSPPDLRSVAGSMGFDLLTGDSRATTFAPLSTTLSMGRGGERLSLTSRSIPVLGFLSALVDKFRRGGRCDLTLVSLVTIGDSDSRGPTTSIALSRFRHLLSYARDETVSFLLLRNRALSAVPKSAEWMH